MENYLKGHYKKCKYQLYQANAKEEIINLKEKQRTNYNLIGLHRPRSQI